MVSLMWSHSEKQRIQSMKKLFSSAAVIALAVSLPAMAQEATTSGATSASSATVCGPQGSSTGSAATTGTSATSTDTTASTSGTTGTATDTTASTSGATGSTTTDTAASSGTTGSSGATGSTTTDTAASSGTTGSGSTTTSSTMALGAVNDMNAQYAESALNNASTNVGKLASIGQPSVVCIVDVDALAAGDTASTLGQSIEKFRSGNSQIRSALEGNTALLGTVKSQHPNFDVNQVLGTDIGPNGELILFVSRKS
jgi:hypothetical protein